MGTLAGFAGTFNPWQPPPPSLSFSRCYTSQHLGPTTPSPLTSRAPPLAAHPGGNSYTFFMTFCMPTVHSSSLPLFSCSVSPSPVSYSPSFFVISRYPRGGKKTRTQGSSRFRGNLSLLSLLAQTVLYSVYTYSYYFFSCWNTYRLELHRVFHPLVFECC